MTETKTNNNNINESNPLGSEKVSGLMLRFAIPSIIAMMVSALYNIVDQLFIGQAVGSLGNAATNIAFPLSMLCTALALAFGIGAASCFNLSMGRGKYEKAPYYIGNAITMLAVCGTILTLLTELFLPQLLITFGSPDDVLPFAKTYVRITALGFPFLLLTTGGGHLIRADGSPKISMICNLSGAVINVILDAIFVIGLNMGMSGAAFATIIGQVFSGIYALRYFTNYKTVHITRVHLIPRITYLIKILQLGAASCFNQISMMVVQITLNNSLKYYGQLSEYGQSIPIACAGIIMKVGMLFFSVVIGISQGIQPIVSFNYGAGRFKRVKEAHRLAIIAGSIISVFAFLLFQLAPRQIISLFGDGSESYFKFGVKFFRIYMFFTIINFMQPISSTFFTSIGKAYKGMFLSLTRQLIFLLPLMLLLPLLMKIDGLLFAGPIADFLAFLVALLMTAYEFKNIRKLESA